MSFAGLNIRLPNGTTYDRDITISITEFGEADNEAVLCRTDLTTCCSSTQTGGSGLGHWIYPNSTIVANRPSRYDIFRSRGNMFVRLHRMDDDVTAPTGQYCCEVPTVANSDARICITLSNYFQSAMIQHVSSDHDYRHVLQWSLSVYKETGPLSLIEI